MNAQLDFIFFLYGLAFILLGGVCFAISAISGRRNLFGMLGSFAVAHGLSEWLDLIALLAGDTPAFALARTALVVGSFVLLLEFARRQAKQLGVRVPGPWLYAVLLGLVVTGGSMGGLTAANAIARYTIGCVAAIATAWVFIRRAHGLAPAERQLWIYAAVGFAVYGIAAGAIVPAAPFWPASVINQSGFAKLTGIPIQLVRGLLACWITIALWMIWKRMVAADVDSARYTASQQGILVWTLVATGTIIGLGWTLTQFLGGIHQRSIEQESIGDIDLLATLLDRQTVLLRGVVKAVAASPTLLPLLSRRSPGDTELAQSTLNLELAASGANFAYLLDKAGSVVASSGDSTSLPARPPAFALTAQCQSSTGSEETARYALDSATGSPVYFASCPILDQDGTVLGTTVLSKSLQAFEADLSGFNRTYFLVDPDGRVMVTNLAAMWLQPLWPSPASQLQAQAAPHGQLPARPMMQREVGAAAWSDVLGERQYVRRRFFDQGQWSLVLLTPDSRIYASRFLGIIVTLLVSIMMMIYLYGRERLIRDHVELESRLSLRDVARGLRLQATTDPLTGLHNRLRFNEALASEMLRAKRHKTALSLMLYDVDHFKAINDTHGHQVGDVVLIQISRWMLQRIRPTDLLARWGGEEFVILAPGSDGQTAMLAAERLRSGLEQAVFQQAGTISCSFGVSQYRDGDTVESMIARADAALYRAKVGGRNRVEMAS